MAPACASDPQREEVGSLGSIQAALAATGPDGATYALPATATLTLVGSASSSTIPLATGASTQSFLLPSGSYAATLAPGVADAAGGWELTRSGGGGATVVAATMADAMPVSLTIAAGQTTSVVFHFLIDGLGDVTFGAGTADTGVAVDAGAFPVSTAEVSGKALLATETLGGPPSLSRALTFAGTMPLTYAVTLTRTGAWTFASAQACAPVQVTAASSRATNSALAALVVEVTNGDGDLCFADGTQQGEFQLHVSRTGASSTAAMTAALPGGGTFALALTGYAPEVLAGTSLRLASLPEPFTVANASVSEIVSSDGGVLAVIASPPSGTASATLRP